MTENKNIFGVEAEDKNLQAKQGGVFGLNTGSITKIAYVEENTEGKDFKAIDLSTKIGDREFYQRFFLNESVYGSGDAGLLNPGDEGYEDAYYNYYSQIVAVIKHALGAVGVSKEAIARSLEGIASNQLVEGMKKMVELAPSDISSRSVDIFLEYQWSIPEGRDRTYLTLPKNMKGGEFLCASVSPVGKWEEVRTGEGMHYVDNSGNKHPFTRSTSFMEGNKANQQGAGAQTNSPDPSASAAAATWDN